MLRSLSAAEIDDLLRTEVVAQLGCHAEGRTCVVPVTYGPLLVSETSPGAETLTEGEALVRRGNGHASIHRIHILEKTGRFERR